MINTWNPRMQFSPGAPNKVHISAMQERVLPRQEPYTLTRATSI